MMHGFGFFPGAFLLPGLFFFGFIKIVLFVLLIALIVRLVSHGHRHAAYAHGYDYGHGYGHGPGAHGWQNGDMDPRRVAAFRYAAGKIDRAEFDRITSGLDAAGPTTPPSTPPTPPAT